MVKRSFASFILLAFLSARAIGTNAIPLVFIHANLIDGTGAPLKSDATVVVIGDRIASAGGKEMIPANARVVDALGKYLIPGLWDMHVHWYGKEYLPLFIANGVTGIRMMWGFPEHHEWRREIEAGSLLGPRMYIASALIDGPNPIWPNSEVASNAAEGRQAVMRAKRGEADFIKVYSRLPRDAYYAIADEAKKEGLPFEGHVPDAITAQEASAAGQKSIEHLTRVLAACESHGAYDEETAQALFAEFKKNETWQCPTFTVLHLSVAGGSIMADDRVKYMPTDIAGYWRMFDGRWTNRTPQALSSAEGTFEEELNVVGKMQRAGVGILAGTDTGNPYCFPGFSLHDELGLLVKAGLSPMEALQAATRNAAQFMKRDDLGTIQVGELADMVLLEANPLDDIANTRKIAAVVYGGRFFARSELDGMLTTVKKLAAN